MILEALKTQTAASHRNVESSPLLQPINDGSLTPEKYILILRKFYGFFKPLEDKIAAITGLNTYIPDLADRRKASSLLQDLSRVPDSEQNLTPIAICPDLPAVTNVSEGLGALYVMEGSTLGGKFISKIIHETLGFTPDTGTAFFSGYGPETGTKWKAFQEALKLYTSATHQQTEVVAAADATFQKLEKWLQAA